MRHSGPGVAPNPAPVAVFIREYLDNGLVVYDADRRRFGTVADYDRSGGCFVVRTKAPDAWLCIPFSLVSRVRRRKVYVSKSARELSSRLLPSGWPDPGWFSALLRWFHITESAT
jgi:hypothetical protein